MASIVSSTAVRLCLRVGRQQAPRLARVSRAQPITRPCHPSGLRAFSDTAARRKEEDVVEEEDQSGSEVRLKKLQALELEGMTPEYQRMLDELAQREGHQSMDAELRSQDFAAEKELLRMEEGLKVIDRGPKPNKDSFWYDEEDPEHNTEGIEEFDEDDITPMAHGKLEEIRDMRHYARLAVWEMPLLAQYAKPFEIPKETEVLRWRYTTYMGEAHQGEKKVVVQFAPSDLGLTPTQESKLAKLAGARYNPSTGIIKMSADSFEHQAQNKRYLSNLVDDLVTAAKDPKDTFEDVPLDTRHHKLVKKPKFPREWMMTKERRASLESHREQLLLEDTTRTEANTLVNGQEKIDKHLMELLAQQRAKEAMMVEAPLSAPKRLRR